MTQINTNLTVGADLRVRPLCILNIGHQAKAQGARNQTAKITEYIFNGLLAFIIKDKVTKAQVKIISQRSLATLPLDINAELPDFIVSMHCNGSKNQNASGTEVLYKSDKGKEMAGILLSHLVNTLQLPNRGIKKIERGDRGNYVLTITKAPMVISEPFFITTDKDYNAVNKNLDGLAQAYAAAIDEIATSLFSVSSVSSVGNNNAHIK